jgi:hypothetical protein
MNVSNARSLLACGHTVLLPDVPLIGTTCTVAADSTPGTDRIR